MKKSRSLSWSQLRVGIVTIVSVVLLAVGILQLGGKAGLFTSTYTLHVLLDNTYGLKVGNTVRLAGLDVGNVKDISFLEDRKDKRVVVTLSLEEKYRDRIRRDSAASIKTLGLLGDKFVELSVGSPGSPGIEEGGVLEGRPETPFDRVLTGASSGLEGLNVVIGQLRDILSGVVEGEGTMGRLLKDPNLYNDLDSAVKGIEGVATDLREAKGTLGKLVREPELYDNLLDVSDKARQVADKLNRGSLVKLSEDQEFYKNLRTVSDNLSEISESANSLMKNLESGSIARISEDKTLHGRIKSASAGLDNILAKLDKGEGSAGKLLKDDELYDNMNKFFRDADALVVDVKENPNRYIHLSLF